MNDKERTKCSIPIQMRIPATHYGKKVDDGKIQPRSLRLPDHISAGIQCNKIEESAVVSEQLTETQHTISYTFNLKGE